jgi:hypothetical protein
VKAAEPCTVVGATLDDLREIMRLLRLLHVEGCFFPLDEQLAEETFIRALRPVGKEGIIGIIRGEGPEIKAMMFLEIRRTWYTASYHLSEVFNYVAPEHRKSNYADALIRYAKHCADELKIGLVIGVLSNQKTLPKIRLYRRRLGMPAGAFFCAWRRVG